MVLLNASGRPWPLQIDNEIDIMFLAALMSLCQSVLHVSQTCTLWPTTLQYFSNVFVLQVLHVLEVMYSSIGMTRRSPSASLILRHLHKTPTTPQRMPFSLAISFPNMPFPKTIRGTFALSSSANFFWLPFFGPNKNNELVYGHTKL